MTPKKMPCIMFPPGRLIEDEMEEKNLTIKEFAEKLDLGWIETYRLLYMCSPITPEIAEKLNHVFGTSKQFWLSLENRFQEWLAKNDFRG